jgi:hypothetical protein
MHCLSSVYWAITPLHVSGLSAAHHQEIECIYVANGTCYTSEVPVSGPGLARWQSTADMPETCRGVVTQQTEDDQCIMLLVIHIIREARSTQHKINRTICCGTSKFSTSTLYSLQVPHANYRFRINSVFVHRKELRFLLIKYPRASCQISIPSLILSFITGFSVISEFYHTFASKYKIQ